MRPLKWFRRLSVDSNLAGRVLRTGHLLSAKPGNLRRLGRFLRIRRADDLGLPKLRESIVAKLLDPTWKR